MPAERHGLSAKTDNSMGNPRARSLAMNAQNQSGSKTIPKDQGEKGVITGGPLEISVCILNRVSACVPSVTGGDALPKERLGTYRTTAYGPPERKKPNWGRDVSYSKWRLEAR